ncbi:DUF5686 family protein [Tenacibaculum geojense]|uniref:DUF5686 family protein n=1 Tax=Tenacibaculum geojense TaxID=915352 RepID=A0ABW3JV67_9FLAO
MKLNLAILLLVLTTTIQAQITIKGKVVDEFDNPLPYVNVYVKGTTYGTTTDDDGSFSFSSKKKRGTIEVSFVGFQTQTFKITPKIPFLNIILKEEANVLDEVVVVTKPKKRLKKKENPAYRILKEIWKRKRKNGVDLVNHYQYKEHEAIEIGLNNLDTAFVKGIFKKNFDEAIKTINYDDDGENYYIPIYLTEKVSQVYGNNKENLKRVDIEAEKEEGLGAQSFVFDRMSNTFQNVDVFKNNITLLQKSFVSPLSSDGFATYDYVLYDSVVKNDTKLYNIYYFPIRDQDLAFKGNFWVSDKNFSIKKIKMEVTKSANLNFVRGLTFDKEFILKNDSIYLPSKNNYIGDFTFIDKNDANKGLTIKKNISYKNYVLNVEKPINFYDVEQVKIRPDQFKKSNNYWNQHHDNTTKSTYKTIKTVKGKRKIKKLTGLLNTITSGYVNLPFNIQAGPFWTMFAQNEVEGFRTKLGFRSFKTKDDRFRISGHVAYGFKDKEFKYGAEARYLLSFQPRITTSIAYQKDIEQLGSVLFNTNQLLGRSFGTAALLNRGNNFYLSNVEKIATNFDYAVHNNFHIGFNFTKANIQSATTPDNFSINYIDQNGIEQNSVTDVASDVYLTFTPGRFVYGLGVEQRFGRNIFPRIVLNYRHGYKDVLNGTHDYDKVQFQYNQPLLLGKFGLLDATVEAGKTFGTVPISLLSPIPANQSFSLVKNTFSLINYYDFVTDTYAATHLEHHFNGFILNRIPLVKRLNLRSLITFRAAYGTVSDKNRAINRSNLSYNTPDKMYYEYGFGFENIGYGNLRFFRIDAIWRSNYTPAAASIAEPTPMFAIRIGIMPGL